MQNTQTNFSSHIIGLTGGIGSGKSTASKLFSELNVEIIDADIIAKELVRAGSPALKTILKHFGQEILDINGELNRSHLRTIIFSNQDEKMWLEGLLHPLIREEIMSRLLASTAPYLIISAPLLLESQHYDFVDRVLVIDSEPALQIDRVLQRDGASSIEIKKIISTQMKREDRLKKADDVILNNQDLDSLKQQVLQFHKTYLHLANKP